MKVMRKERILQKDHGEYIRAERDLLTAVEHPYIVTIKWCIVWEGLRAGVVVVADHVTAERDMLSAVVHPYIFTTRCR
jgi:hypothetical protein